MSDTSPDPPAPTAEEVLEGEKAPVVVFDGVSLAFDDRVILKSVSFALLLGHTKIILGASGAGKSTILRLILGLLKPDAGVIWVNGERVDGMSERELMRVRADIGMVFQEGALFDSLTVRENVGFKLFEETKMPLAEVNRRVEEVLGFVGLLEHIDKMPSALSGGQRRRVAIARAMTAKPRLLLYDEPTTGLDPVTAMTINRLIADLNGRLKTTSVVVTHDITSALFVADRIAFLKNGRFAFTGTPDEARTSDVADLRAFLAAEEIAHEG